MTIYSRVRENQLDPRLYRMELFTQVSGLMKRKMVMANKCGLMVQSMKVNGEMIRQMVKEN